MKKILLSLITFAALLIVTVSPHPAEGAAKEYIIKKGDTLWSISNAELQDTFLWPRLWNVNPHIPDPDLIYPGLKIRIPSREELLQLPYAPKPVAKPAVKPKKIVKIVPKLPTRYILSKKKFITSGWVSKRFPSVGKIAYTHMDREMITKGDTVYIKVNKRKKIESKLPAQLLVTDHSGERYFTIRKNKKVFHPKTGSYMGNQIKITGILEVVEDEGRALRAKVIDSFEDIMTDDELMYYEDMVPPAVPDTIRRPDIEGYVVESKINSSIIGEEDIIYLDKGKHDGLIVGDIFSSIIDDRIKREIGSFQIISLQPETSTALILDTKEEITIGSEWGQKR